MEALAALGLAGNVMQFVQFTSDLLSTGFEVYNSVSGASQKNIELENIYERLKTFTSSLQTHETSEASLPSAARGLPTFTQTTETVHVRALNDLAKDCRELCDQLLETLGQLRARGGRGRRFQSFMAALKTVWTSKKIDDLEARLDRFQRIISLHFFPIMTDQQSSLMRMLAILRQESYSLNLDQGSKLDSIATTLTELTSTTEKLSEELWGNHSGLINPWRTESSTENRGIRQQNQSSFLTLDRLDTLSTEISRLALTEHELEDVAREQAILKSLNFSSRPVRHDNIPFAHEKTFQWMIDPPKESEDADKHPFSAWLKDGNGIFWVSGKAGSGKSTLMKFLADHETTKSILEEWASEMKLVIATHYFWSAGTPMQKSYEGLCQTLLYEIFRMCPVLIPQVCPVRWAQTNTARTEKNADWTASELLGTLQNLSRQSDLPVRYCFFIDGIDEFDGDHFKLCEILRNLSRSSNFKFCLASRPWNVFVDAFGNDHLRRICIEDLTRNDILQYTKSRLMEHQRWNISHFRPKDKQSIIDDITGKAAGVFLWVFLVTNSLRDGLTNGDTMLDLRNRLESLPTDLEQFFKHMLEGVDFIYYEKMASFLSIAVAAKQPLHFLIYSMHEYEYEDEDYALRMYCPPLSDSEVWSLKNECLRRINARCGGLLEIKGSSVEFLHRTVRDFLFTREMSDYLGTKTKSGFSANLSTFRAYVAVLKRTELDETILQESMGQSLLGKSLECAGDALEDSEETVTELLDDLEALYMAPFVSYESFLGWTFVGDPHNFDGFTMLMDTPLDFKFRKELLRAGVGRYVLKKVRESPNYFDSFDEPLLSVVIKQPKWTARHINMIRDLLESGQDPNAKHFAQPSSSPWTSFIQRTCREEYKEDFYNAVESGLFSLFLHCHASRDAYISNPLFAEAFIEDTDDMVRDTPITSCGYFIKAIFSQYSRNNCKSLKALHDFFDLSFSTQLHPAVLDTFQIEIKKVDPTTTRFDQLKFFAQITEKIVNTGVSLGWEMDFLLSDIEKAFPGSLGSTILNLVRGGAGGGKQAYKGIEPLRKRKAETDILDRMVKRTKETLSLEDFLSLNSKSLEDFYS